MISPIDEDTSGNIWFGTEKEGVEKCNSGNMIVLNHHNNPAGS